MPSPPFSQALETIISTPSSSDAFLTSNTSSSVSVMKLLRATTTGRENTSFIFLICRFKFTHPLATASGFGLDKSCFLTPPCILRALTVATRTTASGLRDAVLHLISKNFSAPKSAPKPAAIRELEKLEMVRLNNGRYQLDHAISKRQRIILSSFGIDDDKVKDAAGEISNILKNVKDPDIQPDEEAENGENEVDYFD